MSKPAIIYLHGFNSASVDAHGQLLLQKDKLRVLQEFCHANALLLQAPNVDYRDFSALLEDIFFAWNQLLDQGYRVTFMGSSMGGFASEYLALKTGCHAIMINPAIQPSHLLTQFIGPTHNDTTGVTYHWEQAHCMQYRHYEQELACNHRAINRTLLLDKADELLDTAHTIAVYQATSKILAFEGGSHSFEHMRAALPAVADALGLAVA